MLQHATPHLRSAENGGKVVMVSSGAATGNTSGWGCYNSTKVSEMLLSEGIANGKIADCSVFASEQAALNSLCRTYANEEKSILSFAVRPGMVNVRQRSPFLFCSCLLAYPHRSSSGTDRDANETSRIGRKGDEPGRAREVHHGSQGGQAVEARRVSPVRLNI